MRHLALGVRLTTLIAWIAVDQRGPAAIYLASDSRITWGTHRHRWDVGRKLFACRQSPDIFGYVGEVIFPGLVLGQLTEAADHHLIKLDDNADLRHGAFVRAIQSSFQNRYNAPNNDFEIIHAARVGQGMSAKFRLWELAYSASSNAWFDQKIDAPSDRSALIIAIGSGKSSVEIHNKQLIVTSQGRTSRSVFWAFCDALKSKADLLSGRPPQLVGIYRTQSPKVFGVVYEGRRYFQGLPLQEAISSDDIEWRDENFQRIDGQRLEVIAGAQRHGRSH